MTSQVFCKTKDHKKYLNEWKESQIVQTFYYYHLGIIDSKSSALLRISAIYFAIIALVFSGRLSANAANIHAVANTRAIIVGIVLSSAALFAFISTLLGLSVVWLHWFTLSDLEALNKDEVEMMSKKFHILEARTFRYRMAWVTSLIAFLLISLLMILHIGM